MTKVICYKDVHCRLGCCPLTGETRKGTDPYTLSIGLGLGHLRDIVVLFYCFQLIREGRDVCLSVINICSWQSKLILIRP